VQSVDGIDLDGAEVVVLNAATGFTASARVHGGRFLVTGLEVGGPYAPRTCRVRGSRSRGPDRAHGRQVPRFAPWPRSRRDAGSGALPGHHRPLPSGTRGQESEPGAASWDPPIGTPGAPRGLVRSLTACVVGSAYNRVGLLDD
jgi:hypothetical protein